LLRVGLTGGIACGKSRVLRRLADQGCHTLDLDAVARDVTTPGSAVAAEITAAFGAGILGPGGALDRAALAALVFADPAARARLNAIVHPRVRAAEQGWTRSLVDRPGAVAVTDAALLVEAGAHLRFDRLVVVHCDPAVQIARLRARDGLDERSARARIAAQMDTSEKRAFAHYEVDTSGSLGDTDRAADALAEKLRSLAGRPQAWTEVSVERLMGGLVHGPRHGPRGLAPTVLLAEAAAAGGLEMEVLARRLVPPPTRPWYRTAAEADPGAPAAYLAVALAAWALRRGAPDPPLLAAASGSVARLTHTDPAARADACLLALVAQEVAHSGGDVEEHAGRLAPLAARFGGAPPSGQLLPIWSAARRHPFDPGRAAASCAAAGGDPHLASALAGLGAAVEPSPRAALLQEALARLAGR